MPLDKELPQQKQHLTGRSLFLRRFSYHIQFRILGSLVNILIFFIVWNTPIDYQLYSNSLIVSFYTAALLSPFLEYMVYDFSGNKNIYIPYGFVGISLFTSLFAELIFFEIAAQPASVVQIVGVYFAIICNIFINVKTRYYSINQNIGGEIRILSIRSMLCFFLLLVSSLELDHSSIVEVTLVSLALLTAGYVVCYLGTNIKFSRRGGSLSSVYSSFVSLSNLCLFPLGERRCADLLGFGPEYYLISDLVRSTAGGALNTFFVVGTPYLKIIEKKLIEVGRKINALVFLCGSLCGFVISYSPNESVVYFLFSLSFCLGYYFKTGLVDAVAHLQGKAALNLIVSSLFCSVFWYVVGIFGISELFTFGFICVFLVVVLNMLFVSVDERF